jgi:50S ribosomal protein L16 3-hydroxylase
MLEKNFFDDYWSKQPLLLKGVAKKSPILKIEIEDFWNLCKPPSSIRAFRRIENRKEGGAQAIFLENFEWAKTIYEMALKQNEDVTILVNNAQKVSSKIENFRSSLNVGRKWRYDDVVVTLSNSNSGIGYHAGHEDGFICQIKGERHWKIYHPLLLPEDYVFSLLGLKNYANTPTRPLAQPILDVILEPGDLLYLPPLYGHEGVTLKESISFSIAWKGLTPQWFLSQLGVKCTNSQIKKGEEREFYKIIPEYRLLADDFPQTLIDTFLNTTTIQINQLSLKNLINSYKTDILQSTLL